MLWLEKAPERGDIVRVKVTFYHHYGIFVSPERVIQFGLPEDAVRPGSQVRVLATDVYTFLNGGTIEVGCPDRLERKNMRSADEIVALAEARIGEGGYDIRENNCEHFVNECAFGRKTSSAIDDLRAMFRRKLGK